jgi:lipopolysaccharide export system permease protein
MAYRVIRVGAVIEGMLMNRLSSYVVRLLTRDCLALLAVMLGLLFLIQTLKIFDVIVVQGQDILTLLGQSMLSMPPLAIVIAYVCMGIAIVRVMGGLQGSHELHIVHSSRQLRALFGGIALFAIGGAVIILVLSNFVAPWSSRRLDDWSAAVAADVVGRTLVPHRFGQVVPGIAVVIGSRAGAGNITDFFADDSRDPEMRHTYSAKTATIGRNGEGYVIELHDGTLQYLSNKGDFSEVAFKSYDLGLNRLTESDPSHTGIEQRTSLDLAMSALERGTWIPAVQQALYDRASEGLRALAMCVFMASLTAFPNARRRRAFLPLELVPLLVAYADKTITSNFAGPAPPALLEGPAVILLCGLLIFAFRLRLFRPLPKGLRTA